MTNETVPTQGPDARTIEYTGLCNWHHPDNENGASMRWAKVCEGAGIGRIDKPLSGYYHRHFVMEFSEEPQGGGGWPDHDDDDKNFWPMMSNEYMGHCLGFVGVSAKELFDKMEAIVAADHDMALALAQENEGEGAQVYVTELRDGMAILHFSFNYDLSECPGISSLVGEMRKTPGFSGEWTSDDYFGTYDFYCSDTFRKALGDSFTWGAWEACINKDDLRETLLGRGSDISWIDSAIEHREIDESCEPAPNEGAEGRKRGPSV